MTKAWEHPPPDRWVIALGRIVYLFGFVELVTYDCIAALARPHELALWRDRAFGERCRFARGLVVGACRERQANDAIVAGWTEFFDKAPGLGHRRNVIHNPVTIGVYEEAETGRRLLEVGLLRMRKPDQPKVQIAELEQLAAELATFLEHIGRLDFRFGAQ